MYLNLQHMLKKSFFHLALLACFLTFRTKPALYYGSSHTNLNESCTISKACNRNLSLQVDHLKLVLL